MPRVKRLLGVVAATFLVCAGMGAPPAAAQDTAVSLRLVKQLPWVAKYHRGALDLELSVYNGGSTTLRNLSLVVSFGEHAATQTDYEQMLTTGVTTVIADEEKDVPGEIEPLASPETIQMHVDLTAIEALDQIDSQVYPTRIELKSEATTVASLVTPVIYLVPEPAKPMLSTTWVDLSAPIAFGADGTLVDSTFPASIAEGGALRAPLDAIEATTGGRHPHGQLDLVLDPLVITQARDVADGYRLSDGTDVPAEDQSIRQAKRFLTRLQKATTHPETLETIALPFANPVVPAMLNSGLGDELQGEQAAGKIIVDSLDPTGTPVANPDVAHPFDGRLSDEALAWLSGTSGIVLGNADTVDRTPYQGALAPSPTVPTSSGTLVLPDPTTQALFDRPELFADPVLGAQIILGELAVIWKQQPAPTDPTLRGIAVAPPPTLPADAWAPLLSRLADAPFLTPVTATLLVEKIEPENENAAGPLAAPDSSRFEPTYATNLIDLSTSVEAYGSMLPADDQTPTDLRRRLYLATAPPYLLDPAAGQPWISSVQDTTQGAFAALAPPTVPGRDSTITLTSREGTIPIQMGDPGPTPLDVTVELQSTSFTYPNDDPQHANPQDVHIDRPGQIVSFDVVAQGSGQNPIDVVVFAPNGQEISRTRITVRSTTFNRTALLITSAAAVGLVALYGRRWVRRRRRATA
jgi:hypothetical protein